MLKGLIYIYLYIFILYINILYVLLSTFRNSYVQYNIYYNTMLSFAVLAVSKYTVKVRLFNPNSFLSYDDILFHINLFEHILDKA